MFFHLLTKSFALYYDIPFFKNIFSKKIKFIICARIKIFQKLKHRFYH
eukprot:UN07869